MDKPWKVILAFVAMFLAGAVCGGLIAVRIARSNPPRERGVLSLTFGAQMIQRLEEKLALTPEQSAKIRPIVEKTQTEVQRLRKENVRNITQAMDLMHSEISAELTPEQRVKLEDLRKKFLERADRIHREFRAGDRPPPPPR